MKPIYEISQLPGKYLLEDMTVKELKDALEHLTTQVPMMNRYFINHLSVSEEGFKKLQELVPYSKVAMPYFDTQGNIGQYNIEITVDPTLKGNEIKLHQK